MKKRIFSLILSALMLVSLTATVVAEKTTVESLE